MVIKGKDYLQKQIQIATEYLTQEQAAHHGAAYSIGDTYERITGWNRDLTFHSVIL